MIIIFIFLKFTLVSHFVVLLSLIGMRLTSSLKIKRVISIIAIFGSLLGTNSIGNRIENYIPQEELMKIATSGSLVFKMILAMLAVYLLFKIITIVRRFRVSSTKISWDFLTVSTNVFYSLQFFSPLITFFRDEVNLQSKLLKDEAVIAAGMDRDLYVEKLLSYSQHQNHSKAHYKQRIDALYINREGGLIRNILIIACLTILIGMTHYFFSVSVGEEEKKSSQQVIVTGENGKYLVRISDIKTKDQADRFTLLYQISGVSAEDAKLLVKSFQKDSVLGKIYNIFIFKDHNEIVLNQNHIQREIDKVLESVINIRLQSSLMLEWSNEKDLE